MILNIIKINLLYLVINLLILTILPLMGQEFQFQRKVKPFPVYDENNQLLEFPFFGGFNTPVLQLVDIDGDSDPDLFIQDRANQLTYYMNNGTAQSHQYLWQTDFFENLNIGAWFKFTDIDNDDDFDLFTENPVSIIRFYRNDGTANQPIFTCAADTLRDHVGNIIFVDGFSIPEWTDIDNDNDQELFMGKLNGRITYYELNGFTPDNIPIFEFVTDTFQNILIISGGSEASSRVTENPASKRHGANSLTFVDIDGDADNDLFWGDFFAESIIFLENIGSSQTPQFDPNNIIEEYPPGNPIMTGGFNVPRFADINNDGDFDMFVGVLEGWLFSIKDRIENLYYYENTGNFLLPAFTLRTKQFIEGIDLGRNSIPAFTDIDNDNDYDMFIANQEDYQSPSNLNSRVYFFKNQGSSIHPQFKLVNLHYLNYDKIFDVNYAPVFCDIDSDGDQDLFLGKWDGKVTYYRNDGSAVSANFVRIDEFYFGIDIGSNSTPTFSDIDNDNDLDLFIGEISGNINYYRNDGTQSSPNFVLDTTHYFGIDPGFEEYSYPFFSDIERDLDADLFIGTDTKGILFYRNEGSVQSANFIFDPTFAIPLQLRTSPNLIDIDDDGDLDLFSGVSGGGLIFYENREFISKIGSDHNPKLQPAQILVLSNYPNPFNPHTTIYFELKLSSNELQGNHKLTIHNILGQTVKEWIFRNTDASIKRKIDWNGRDQYDRVVPSGIYFYTLRFDNGMSYTAKTILVR